MAASNAECSQWLSVTEETLFLHDGLLRVTDLVELPDGVENCGSKDNEVVSFDTKIPEELSAKLIELCSTRNNAFNTLQEYRLNALKGLWRAQKLLGQDEHGERESNQQQDDAISLLKKQGLIKDTDQASFSTRISLLLILPLLQSQSKTDPELCGVTSGVILTCLKDCPPLSLAKEPSDCLIGLESLLCGWLGEKYIWCTEAKDKKHQENAAAALVALACARGFVKTFIHAVHLLQQQREIPPLPVGNVLASLLDCEGGGHCQVSSFLGARHILSWGVDDMLGLAVPQSGSEETKENIDKDKEQDIGRSIATDGCFLYTTNSCGRGISKLGTGRHGTLRGYVYCKNTEIGPGRMAYAKESLFFRPQSYDQDNNKEYLAQLIDANSLQPLKTIIKPPVMMGHAGAITTVSFCSDGISLYWLWCPTLVGDKTAKGISVNVTSFTVEKSLEAVPVQSTITLQKKEDASQKGMNEALLTRLRPLRVSNSAATLMAFTGTDTVVPNRKEETAPGVGSTSCGVLLKTLVKTPIYCDGNHLVMLIQPPGGAAGASARSLFGGSGSIQGMRALASNMCFNVKSGFFTARVDLVDAPSSSVGRGTLPTCVGSCFDVENNLLWMSSGEYVDVFNNPGSLAPHHIHKRLGITETITSEALKASSTITINTVIAVLLQNVGSMCLHQMAGELYPHPSFCPTACNSGENAHNACQNPLDFEHLNRVMDILAGAVSDQDGQAIICCLVVLQLIFKTSSCRKNEESSNCHIQNARSLMFKLLTDEALLNVDEHLRSLVKAGASRVITLGLRSLYSSYEDRQRLLYDLLTSGKEHSSLIDLRNSILTDLAEQLNRQQAPMTDVGFLQLSDDLVSFVLKLAVKESCVLLKEVQTFSKEDLQDRLANLPILSPAVLYLTALRSYHLRCAIFHESTNERQEPPQNLNLSGIQDSILSLVSKMIEGACQVLETFIETCISVLNTCVNGDLEHWLAAFERLAKSTILGTLMPVLITALTHRNLQCLAIAQALTPPLVRLTLFSSRAVLLMKSEELEASTQLSASNEMDLSADREMADMIGEVFSCDLDSSEEEEGFLTGLKIPAPWASGKTVETIHPVRDNYKFKETVHIPGARCLYLRFDPRCSSQYDYDKVVIYAGPSVNGKKIVEYGGNSYGFGSRSVLGSGWPKDLVKVEGDTVTLTFEMRSGREHNTPDKAMWGFACTIRAQESAEEESPGLPFLSDLALGLSVLLSTYLSLLYHGSSQTQDEIDCQHLLKSRLLQRCVWTFEKSSEKTSSTTSTSVRKPKADACSVEGNKEMEYSTSTATALAHIKLPKEMLVKLRKLTKWQAPHVKLSVVPILRLDVIEERAVSAIAKHLGLDQSVCQLGKLVEQQGEELAALKAIMEETYRKFDILARQLQVMADLEKMWHIDVEDRAAAEKSESLEEGQTLSQPDPPFFHDYHLRETCHKDLATIAFLKDVAMETDMEAVVNNLLEKFHRDVQEMKALKVKVDKSESRKDKSQSTIQQREVFSKTKQIVSGILSRLDLLLHVNSVPLNAQCALTRTLSYTQGFKEDFVARSDTDVSFSHFGFGRSMSAPVGIDESSIFKQHRWRQAEKQRRMASILQDLVDDGDEDKPPHIIVIDQLFAFIGNDPLKMVSSAKFLKAAEERHRRGCSRKEALIHVKELLSSAAKIGGATHLITAVSSVLRYGPKVDDLVCGGMVTEVRDVFAEAMSSVVQLAARYPIHSASSIGLLCTIPYTRAEEKCLVRSGLVHLLDNLCGLGSHRVNGIHAEIQTPGQKVSALAWAGFQVLASRCVKWEVEDGSQVEELEHSGLAKQVSMLLTHHLARATEGIGNAMAGTEALQEVLSLLNNLSRSRMGKAILSQPACVSKLLSLLLDQRPSPKLILIILQLCRVSLPLMNCEDCQEVELPVLGQQLTTHWSSGQAVSDPPARIISLLLAKLGDFLVPGEQVLLSNQSSQEVTSTSRTTKPGDVDKGEDSDVLRGRLSVFVHKRNDQTSHEVIQPLLNHENRPFRLVGTASVDKVVRLDREISKNGKAELTTEEAVSAFRKAYKWAQLGLVVSLAPPSDASPMDSSGSDKKKATSEVICKEKNSELLRTDPVRAFISGHVANAMAAEVIALLHNLLSTHISSSAQTWSQAVQRVLANALSGLPMLLSSLEALSSPRTQSTIHLMAVAKLANAALCALGGFQETIKPGCEIKVMGEGVSGTKGTVVSVSEQNDVVTIQLDDDKKDNSSSTEDKDFNVSPPTYSDIIKVPITRVKPIRNDLFTQYQRDMSDALLSTVKVVILPIDESTSPLSQPLYSMGDANSMANQISRVVAEIRTRTSMVLAQYMQDIDFTKKFIDQCGCSIDMLKSMAKECNTGCRQPIIESHSQRLRMLYRDCAKPPPPPCRTDIRPTKEMMWDVVRAFPPARACLFSQGMTGVSFLGDPSAGIGLPRGTMVYANQPIPKEAPSFYWELEIISFGDAQAESGAVVSFGFAPSAEKKDGAWTNPVGTCLFLNTGKAVHYNGASLLQWRSVRLEITLNGGDVAGIGWEKTGDSSDSTQVPKGQVYFTHNGQKLAASLDSVSGAMYPVVHIQKKNCRVKANFGARPFAFAEGQQHRDAAEAANDVLRDIRESFGHLPFHSTSDSESDTPESTQAVTPSESSRDSKSPPKVPCKSAELPTTLKEYDIEISQNYKHQPCYDNFILTGPDSYFSCPLEDDSDEETVVDDSGSEDHYALLVKAWEQKVFPVIRRRFRNEAERKDGLEQIRGALQLGMTDIARQTVEFLYEENGGIPRDLHLPTIDDIKEDLAKFTIDRVKKGTTVNIRTPVATSSSNATTQLPKFAVRSMLRTFGLTGTVLDVDSGNECVQVETYLRSEGVLVRFWYPLVMLEKPVQGMRKASITGGQTMDTSNILIHRELLSSESSLTRMYLRNAFLRLTDHCNSPAMEVASCSSSLGSGMAVCASTLQELDLENIQLLSEQLLMSPYTSGTLEAQSPFQTPTLSHLLATQQVSLTDIVYRDSLRLKRELATAIARASDQGEDYLIELTNQLCMCLQTAPETFPFMSFPVNDSKVSTDVHFPGAACILVSCLKNSEAANKETPPYRAPWARISTYTGKRIKKCGQVTKQKVVCYPRDVHNQTNTSDQFAPAIIPGDRLFVKIGVSPPPGVTITLHALPPQFLLALAYIETLVTETFSCGMQACGTRTGGAGAETSNTSQLSEQGKRPSSIYVNARSSRMPSFMSWPLSNDELSNPSLWSIENIMITPVVFLHLLEFLCGYLWKTDVPALLKEYTFHLLAQTMRILHFSENCETSFVMKPESRFSPTHRMLSSLHRELKNLYELESKTMAKITTPAGPGMGLGVTDSGRFSTYFQALMETCLAIFEVVPTEISVEKEVGDGLLEDSTTAAGSTSAVDMASGSLASGKKKRLKARKERTAISTRRSSSSDQRAAVETLLDADGSLTSSALTLSSQADEQLSVASVSSGSSPLFQHVSSGYVASDSNTSQLSASLKTEDMTWFTRAVSISKILRFLALKESHCFQDMKNAVSCAASSLSSPTAHSKLLVITGIPPYLDLITVKKSIRKVCNSLGGLEREEIFIPIIRSKKASPETPGIAVALPSSKSTIESSLECQTDTSNNSKSDPSMDSSLSMQEHVTMSTSNASSSLIGTGIHSRAKSKLIEGSAVISIPSKTKIEIVRRAFLKTKWLNVNSVDDPDSPEAPDENLNVHTVNQALLTEPEANNTLESYLKYKLLQGDDEDNNCEETGIGKDANQVLTEIFYSCFFLDQQQDSGDICLSHEQIMNLAPENLLAVFFNNVRPSKKPLPEAVTSVLRQYGCQRTGDKLRSPTSSDRGTKGKGVKKTSVRSQKEKQVLGMVEKGQEEKHQPKEEEKKDEGEKVEKSSSPKDSGRKEGATANVPVKESKSASKVESRLLTLEGFIHHCSDLATQDLRTLWKGLFSCGFDLHLERCACSDLNTALQMMQEWTLEKDTALVYFINELCRQLSVSSARLHPHEIRLSEANLSSETYFCLQGLPPESIRLRFAFLQSLNNSLESFFLPLVDLRPGKIYSRCTSFVLSQLRSLIFYDTKVNFFNRILNASAKRKPDQAAPEITLNPIEGIGTGDKEIQSSILCQSYRQLSSVNSKNFCVRLASGGDPTYAFNVRMTGEEVHGNSGSFRHYLWQVAKELQSATTGLLIPGPNKGRWLIMPGQMTFPEENLLLFLGQLLGITMRADIPLGLDLLPTVWKLLVGMNLDPSVDLKQADPITYGFIKRIEMAETESELESIVGEGEASCLFPSLTGCDINVMQGSPSTPISWSHRQEYMDAIKELRMRELTCPWRMQAVCAGISSVVPNQVLSLMTPWDLEMRTSGRTHISLDFLKAHTMYQVGLVESDPHIEHFWSALESLSQEELARFVKFACNQERIPQMCPCQEGGPDSAHVPPYPMKIAPPDGSGPPDSRYIRVETCMFMVKLPQYSSYEVMLQKLLYAINCREDPLSG